MMLNLVGAFVRRDYLNWTSYRFNALWQSLGLLVTIFVLFLVGRALGQGNSSLLAQYNTDYAGFLMTSLTFVEIWSVGFLLSRGLRESQSVGTLEAMMLSRFGIFRLLLGTAAFPTVVALVRLVILALAAVTIFGLWHGANLASAVVVFVVGLLAMGCLGILSVSFVLVLKQGDPIFAVYGLLNGLFAGTFIPRDVLPHWLQVFSLLLPLTYALEGMRLALKGENLLQIGPEVLALLAFFLVLLPITIVLLKWAVRRAKREGSLVQY
jgi:ABC-2 type transport system permease protein